MYAFNVKFCRNNWKNTLNPDDVVTVEVDTNSFDTARKKARKKANEIGYLGKDGWKWYSTTRVL